VAGSLTQDTEVVATRAKGSNHLDTMDRNAEEDTAKGEVSIEDRIDADDRNRPAASSSDSSSRANV
jgi:hypothetical protein